MYCLFSRIFYVVFPALKRIGSYPDILDQCFNFCTKGYYYNEKSTAKSLDPTDKILAVLILLVFF